MAERSDDMMRTRIDASSTRLTSLRTTTADAAAAASRRPKFVPKAARRRAAGEEGGDEAPAHREPGTRGTDVGTKPQRAGDLTRDTRGRGGRSSSAVGDGSRGRGRGRGRGANLPTGRVAFVGTLSGGSSYSSGGPVPPRTAVPSKPSAAADGVGISMLDDEDGAALYDEFGAMEIEEQWPPVVKSVMEPMSLPFARRPEPPNTGAVFVDPTTNQFILPNDTLLFLQLPTTLPLASATRVVNPLKQQDAESQPEAKAPVNKFAVTPEEPKGIVKKDEDVNVDELADQKPEEQVFDKSIATAPGGFVGKLCVHRSGKVVLMLGDKKFDVATAHTPAFSEELFSIDTAEQQLYMLGPIDRHLVVTPDFDALLA